MPADERGEYLRRLLLGKGWQVKQLVAAMEATGKVAKEEVSDGRVRGWLSDGPPKAGPRHQALLEALGIGEGSREQAILQGLLPAAPPDFPPQAPLDLVGWLRRLPQAEAGIELAQVDARGLRPLAPADGEAALYLPEGGQVQIRLFLDARRFAVVLNHSRPDGALFLLLPTPREPDGRLVPEGGQATLPPSPDAKVAIGYPVGGPKGVNDLYVLLLQEPLPAIGWLAEAEKRALTPQEAQALGAMLDVHRMQLTELRHVAYQVI